ncbi:GIY-YIG nuclease family protein, partial [Candidatus Deferrimicrobium sp.]|uniref:GIY-YIG nuclease family protein n=1 Tax=Candidatus Deferrimicrobium sp. TaxID=3060586 RepID=UPI003C312F7C
MDKKVLKKVYKDIIQPMGIYQIKNNNNGKIFIGRAKNINGILNSKLFQLRNGLHINKDMQKDFNDVGETNFTFKVLDYLKPKEDSNYDYTEELK